jgi:zona occludens toxin
MALLVYTGQPGSGKSYEVVLNVVIPAVKAGRRVLTNIDGMNSEAIRNYCVSEYSSDVNKLGSVVLLKQSDIASDNFFPHILDSEIVPGHYIVSPGDVVCIDEGFKFWKEKLRRSHLDFFREHRHFADPVSRFTCELVIMTQIFSTDLHRDIRGIVSQNYVTYKAKAIRDNLYTITQYDGNKQTKGAKVRDWTRTYDPKIFPLYKSYFGGVGTESGLDSRQKFLNRAFLYKVGIFVLGAAFIIYRLINFVYHKVHVEPVTQAPSPARPGSAGSSSPQPVQPGVPGAPLASPGGLSSEWRISGVMVVGGRRSVVLVGSSGRVRIEPTDAFVGEGASESGMVDGQKVTRFSGQVSSPGVFKP